MTPDPSKDRLEDLVREIREQLRRLGPLPGPWWARVLNHQLTAVVVGFLLTWCLGVLLTDRITQARTEVREREERARVTSEARLMAVQSFSAQLEERRVRAELLLSALRRNLDLPELMARRAAYVQAYVEWEKHRQSNLLTVRRVTDASEQSPYEVPLSKLGDLQRLVDEQLTAAYDRRLQRRDAGDLARADSALKASARCGHEIVYALHQYVAERTVPSSPGATADTTSANQTLPGLSETVMTHLNDRCSTNPSWPSGPAVAP
ncbi:MAG TPA: hypothetical protein VF584_18330 [Longimicrobium sp.]|jgi:hypothetical protein